MRAFGDIRVVISPSQIAITHTFVRDLDLDSRPRSLRLLTQIQTDGRALRASLPTMDRHEREAPLQTDGAWKAPSSLWPLLPQQTAPSMPEDNQSVRTSQPSIRQGSPTSQPLGTRRRQPKYLHPRPGLAQSSPDHPSQAHLRLRSKSWTVAASARRGSSPSPVAKPPVEYQVILHHSRRQRLSILAESGFPRPHC